MGIFININSVLFRLIRYRVGVYIKSSISYYNIIDVIICITMCYYI